MSTVRVFFDNKRLATGVPYKTSFLQVFPTKQTFPSEAEWRTFWTRKMMDLLRFEVEAEIPADAVIMTVAEANKVVNVPASTPAPKTATQPARAPVSASKPSNPAWICSYCKLPPGNDHRPCVCRARYSVAMWEANRMFPTMSENAGKVSSKDNWQYSANLSGTFPAGSYYIGDICYALSTDVYDNVFGKGGCSDGYKSGTYTCNKGSFMVDGTAYGDGAYMGSDGFEYLVDAGIIGIVSVSACAKEDFDKNGNIGGGQIYTFPSDVQCLFKRGIFKFDCDHFSLTVDTVGRDEDW